MSMTNMTTDAAEARAKLNADLTSLRGQMARIAALDPNEQPAYPNGVRPFGTGDLRHFIATLDDAILATAEAASGAGEREELAAFGASEAAGYQYPGADQAAERAAFCAGAAHAASLPPATDPAMVADAADWMEEARKAAAATRPRSPWAKAVMRGDRDDSDEVRAAMFAIDATRAALAAAPTIPATGEAK